MHSLAATQMARLQHNAPSKPDYEASLVYITLTIDGTTASLIDEGPIAIAGMPHGPMSKWPLCTKSNAAGASAARTPDDAPVAVESISLFVLL